MEETRNKAALDRALAPPFRPEGRRPVFRFVDILFCLKNIFDFFSIRSKPLKKKGTTE